jgi:prophage maintenance system killer protein
VKKLTLDEILMFHRKIVKKTGGREGLRDKSLLESQLINSNKHLMERIYIQPSLIRYQL